LLPSWSYSAHKISLAIVSKMISSSQMPCAHSAIQSRTVAAQRGVTQSCRHPDRVVVMGDRGGDQ
jgi:hypothetical protein